MISTEGVDDMMGANGRRWRPESALWQHERDGANIAAIRIEAAIILDLVGAFAVGGEGAIV